MFVFFIRLKCALCIPTFKIRFSNLQGKPYTAPPKWYSKKIILNFLDVLKPFLLFWPHEKGFKIFTWIHIIKHWISSRFVRFLVLPGKTYDVIKNPYNFWYLNKKWNLCKIKIQNFNLVNPDFLNIFPQIRKSGKVFSDIWV